MSVTWTLFDAAGGPLATQPPARDPLNLKFDNDGKPHLDGQTDIVMLIQAEVDDTGPVTIKFTPDNSGYTLDETLSDPTELPGAHGGVTTWVNGSGGLTTLTFTAPSAQNQYWDWGYGDMQPPIALRVKVRVKRV
jgi:hypothetical protein